MAYGCLQKTRLVFVNRLENETPFFFLEPLDTLKAKVASSLADVFPLTGDNRQTIASIFLCTAWSANKNMATQDKLDQLHLTLADCKLSFPGTQFYTFEATKDNANQMRTYINTNEVELCLDEKPQFHIIASTLTGGAPFASLVEELAITHAKMGLPHVHVLQSLGGAGNTQKLTEPSQVTGQFLHAMVIAMVIKPSQLQAGT